MTQVKIWLYKINWRNWNGKRGDGDGKWMVGLVRCDMRWNMLWFFKKWKSFGKFGGRIQVGKDGLIMANWLNRAEFSQIEVVDSCAICRWYRWGDVWVCLKFGICNGKCLFFFYFYFIFVQFCWIFSPIIKFVTVSSINHPTWWRA